MVYSKEEKEIIMEGLKSIQNWIETEIQPNLKESIVVDFGDYVKRGAVREREYRLAVRKDEIAGSIGDLSLLFDIKDWQKGVCGWINIWEGDYYAISFGATLMTWWPTVKRMLLDSIYEQKKQSDCIMNFKV